MLRIHQSSSVAAAKSYYSVGLQAEGYYAKEGEGVWLGKAAGLLGLRGEVRQEDFDRLCDNQRPDTGAKLNPRNDRNRKVGYDFTFSAPKSVSILVEILEDRRILEVFTNSVRATMALIEDEIEVRVRKKGVVAVRRTSNLIYAEFIHHTTRPVILPGESASTVDPALHCHCYAMNTSFDPVEGIFKAGDFFSIKRDAPYFEAVFHSKLAEGIARLGYGITPKALGFEIRGVSETNIRCFSQRTAEIEELAARLGLIGNAKAKAALGAKSRKAKYLRPTKAELLKDWRIRIDRRGLDYHLHKPGNPEMTASRSVALALNGCFERDSVVPFRRLLGDALRIAAGAAGAGEVESCLLASGGLLTKEVSGRRLVTTKEVLAEEEEILRFLNNTKKSLLAINPWPPHLSALDEDQQNAIQAILETNDQAVVVEGKAGTGKTSLMKSAVAAIEATGFKVFTFAPTSQASHGVLRAEGFEQSETVQGLLINSKLHERISPHSVLWIDEAGLLSVREMLGIIRIAQRRNARIVLSGDRYQHHSVQRGDAFRLVVESGLVEVKATRSIYRQRCDRHRAAVRLLSEGDAIGGLQVLDQMGVIHEAESFADQVASVAIEYVESRKAFGSVLVISPTHAEGRLLTAEIRRQLLLTGELDPKAFEIPVLRSRNLSKSEREQHRFVAKGDVIRFHQNAQGGFRKSETWVVKSSAPEGIVVRRMKGDAREVILPSQVADHYQVYTVDFIEVAVGDRVRLSSNLTSMNGTRLFNGGLYTITGQDRLGNVILDHHHRLPRDCGMLEHGYVVTSHSSQGKTVGKVIISQSCASENASSREQIYVSASRSRDAISIWTDDKVGLFESAQRSDCRLLASELTDSRSFVESLEPDVAEELEREELTLTI